MEPGTARNICTVLRPSTEVVSCVRSLVFAVSPQLTMGVVTFTRSNAITLFGRIGSPVFGPEVAMVPALAPDAVGAARTMFASVSFKGFFAGRGPGARVDLKMKSEAGFRTGTAMTGVICGTTMASLDTGAGKRSQYVTRYIKRHGIETCYCASRMARASASSLLASQTGSITSSQKVSALSVRGCMKNA